MRDLLTGLPPAFPDRWADNASARTSTYLDLAAPHLGNGPVQRIAAPDNDCQATVRALRPMADKLDA